MATVLHQTETRRPSRWRRKSTLLYIIFLLPFALILITLLSIYYGGRSALVKAHTEADRLDPGWRLAELEARRSPFPEPAKNGIDNLILAQSAMPTGNWPQWPFPQFNADPIYLDKVRDAMRLSLDGDRMTPTLLNSEQERVLRAELQRVAVAAALARRMPDYPSGRAKIAWTKDIVSTILPHLVVRSIARVLSNDARLRAHDGDLIGAFQNAKATLYCSRAVGEEPFGLSQLMRCAYCDVATDILESNLAYGRVPENELLDLQKELEQEAESPFFLIGARGERALMNSMLENFENGEVPYQHFRTILAGSRLQILGQTAPKGILQDLLIWYLFQILQNEHAKILQYMNEIVELGKLPSWEMVDLVRAKEKALRQKPTILDVFCPNTGTIAVADTRTKAALRTAITALAMERYNLATGRWPDKLEELVPQYLPSVPLDPFDGAPLRLTRKGSAIIVYSISLDKVDQEGILLNSPMAKGSDLGFVLLDPGQRRQPAKPFEFPKRDQE